MDEKKASLTDDIPARILNGYVDSYNRILTKIVNTSLERNCFPNQLAVHKKKFFNKDFLSKCDQIHWKLLIWLHLRKKSLTENLAEVPSVFMKKVERSKEIYCPISILSQASIIFEE